MTEGGKVLAKGIKEGVIFVETTTGFQPRVYYEVQPTNETNLTMTNNTNNETNLNVTNTSREWGPPLLFPDELINMPSNEIFLNNTSNVTNEDEEIIVEPPMENTTDTTNTAEQKSIPKNENMHEEKAKHFTEEPNGDFEYNWKAY